MMTTQVVVAAETGAAKEEEQYTYRATLTAGIWHARREVLTNATKGDTLDER